MTMSKPTGSITEISVEDAAKLLGVSTRMVTKYIEARRIKAIKVKSKWFVDLASVEAFSQATGLRAQDHVIIKPIDPQINPLKDKASESSEIVNPKKKDEDPVLNENLEKPEGKNKSPHALACYRLCLQAFNMPFWKMAEMGEPQMKERLSHIQFEILENLGAGFYSYGDIKCYHYRKARGSIGAALALAYSREDISKKWEKDVFFVETKVLPAFSSLIKKVERELNERRKAT